MSVPGVARDENVWLGAAARSWTLVAAALGLAGWGLSALLVAASEHGIERFHRSYLVAFTFFLSLALGALFFVLIGHLTRAAWNVTLRRLAEAVTLAFVPLALLALVVFVGRHELYEWTHAEVVATDALLQHKRAYLNTPFFLARVIFYFVVWGTIAIYFATLSARQDDSGDPELTLQMERMAAPSMIFYAMTLTFASFDFLMSLYPHWYSTMYGVYYFAGGVLGSFCLITLLAAAAHRAGRLRGVVHTEHFHDLGKLIFAFVVFWAYIAFSQYMLIWYANIPEESVWLAVRQEGPWGMLSLILLFGHFVAPFLLLMSRHPKRRGPVLVIAAAWILLMHWFDLFWLVMPEASPHDFPFHLLDLGTALAVGGTTLAVVFWRLGRAPLVPLRDPRLEESLGLENV